MIHVIGYGLLSALLVWVSWMLNDALTAIQLMRAQHDALAETNRVLFRMLTDRDAAFQAPAGTLS